MDVKLKVKPESTPIPTDDSILLELDNLHTYFETKRGVVKAVNGVSYTVRRGKTLGIVGESGSGKSVSAMSILRLLDGNGKVVDGKIKFKGRNMTELSMKELSRIRGNEISVIFQEPMTSLNPLRKIGWQVEEALAIHTASTRAQRRRAALEAMTAVELSVPENLYKKYPHELSGGMRQRVMLAAAILMRPKLLICDEPTTALDVTTGAQILALLRKLNQEYGVGILFISHDLSAVRRLCEHVLIMHNGLIVESGTTESLFANPQEAYTKKLIASLPERRRYRG